MPAAAVTPAPIAYIKVVAVKKLVVGFLSSAGRCRPIKGRRTALGRRCQSRRLLTVGQYHRSGRVGPSGLRVRRSPARPVIVRGALNKVSRAAGNVYFEQIRVLQAGAYLRLNSTAWNDGIGPRSYFVGFSRPEVMVNRDGRGHSYCDARGEILGPSQDERLRKHLPRMFSLIKNESRRFEDDQIPS